MAKFFEKLFKKKQQNVSTEPKGDETTRPVLPRPKYDFVEQYTIIDPKKVLNGGYRMWELCEKVPVVCEESEVSPCGFRSCIELPTNIVMGFLCTLEAAESKTIEDPKMRTLSIVHMSDNHRIVIGPNFESPKTPVFWLVAEDAPKKDWILHVTPEKNRALVDALKIHTR